MKKIQADVVIVGTGVAGLFCALNIDPRKKVIMVTKKEADKSDSYLAQGGVCVLKKESDFNSYYEDTMRAGHYENNGCAVKVMIRQSPEVIDDIIGYGVEFHRSQDGKLMYTKEGAHSHSRILFHEDITGKEITTKLLAAVRKCPNVQILEQFCMVDLITHNNRCFGIVGTDKESELTAVYAANTVLASGGVGGLYQNSTNFRHITADAVAIAILHGIQVQNINYVQIHPTTLYSQKEGRRFLISESVRGEGAKLYNAAGERFVDELLPRDLLTQEIYKQMKKDQKPYVWLDMRPIGEKTIREHFPNIYERCLEEGYDPLQQPIPVVPAQHYFMGGIKANLDARTTMKNLFAVGETACNGVHGKNRLASNSLLESLVFSKRAAHVINDDDAEAQMVPVDDAPYQDLESLKQKYKKIVWEQIERKPEQMMDPIAMKINADNLILQALQEDITQEDVTTNAVLKQYTKGTAQLLCKQDGVIAGLGVFKRVFELLDPTTEVDLKFSDGQQVQNGDLLATVTGDMRVILSGERTALNFLQRMSGIATYTHKTVQLLEGSKIRLLDTRKTTPNMRIFEKYAVRAGGGCNHRYNLSDGILLKDNHIGAAGGVQQAIKAAKEYAPFVRKIEVETETLEMVQQALEAGADIIMLDNMYPETVKQAVALIDGKAQTEVSGNITKENIDFYKTLGIDFISSGALTHSAPILDVSLKNLHPIE